MENDTRVTLAMLLTLKTRREQSLRAKLAANARQQEQLRDKKALLLEERYQIWKTWRSHSTVVEVLDATARQTLKNQLTDHFQNDQALAEQIDTLQAQWQALQIDKAQQQTLLRKVLMKQEKFNTLLE
ncbi:Putative uncharacterized protein [Mycoavidus cysteinexigens]|uniref:Uncharacterized protein n=1 Tax=Mycoavidus cysteinexigens TaxID=1553431 RepID=A0A2Z6ETL1_9BURK|nr:hypothetical protein [Mycoavidus cysteinexigens]BBE08764.1 Putative uncharacterized protein [Mycoavidus cysteinexigens]GLR01586.1 hypothetical protein GCM10007934_13980 [Mycoavidus cysteinexigens]